MGDKGRSPAGHLTTPEEQFNRCMSENPEFIQNSTRTDLTPDEIAEYRCKKEMCYLMRCMASPARLSTYKRDALTGDEYYGPKCGSEIDTMNSCLARERTVVMASIVSKKKAGAQA